MKTYKDLRGVIDNFNREFPRPNLPLALEELTSIKTKEMWQNADKKGLYFLFDGCETLLYIGKASFESNIGRRIGTRFSCKDCRCLDLKFSEVELLATISLKEDRIFEASSIEEYLLTQTDLNPPLNVIGVNKSTNKNSVVQTAISFRLADTRHRSS